MRGGKNFMSSSFQQLGLKDHIYKVTEKLYFKQPTEIQEKAIPLILQGKSIIGQSKTGSGKTHAFLLPLLNNLDEEKQGVQIVITAPTRELAVQLFEEVKTFRRLANKEDKWTARLLIGGMDRERMIKQLKNNPQIIVGTPGRILDMIDEGALSIYHANSFVIDEADLMLDLKFIDKIDALLVRTNKEVQIVVFSATFPVKLQHFLKKYLQNPTHIKIDSKLSPETLEHRLIENKPNMNLTEKIIEITEIIQPYVAILFTNSKDSADEIGNELRGAGLQVGILHGGLSSRERMRVIKGIHNLEYAYVVATDLASRGIDIKGASHVINVELPKEEEFYIHRVGRTARAGLKGTAISFFTEDDLQLITKLEKKGITFIYSDIKQGEWKEVGHVRKRELRKKTVTDADKQAWQMVKKPKKVKPGYKKKMKAEQQRIKKRILKQKGKK